MYYVEKCKMNTQLQLEKTSSMHTCHSASLYQQLIPTQGDSYKSVYNMLTNNGVHSYISRDSVWHSVKLSRYIVYYKCAQI